MLSDARRMRPAVVDVDKIEPLRTPLLAAETAALGGIVPGAPRRCAAAACCSDSPGRPPRTPSAGAAPSPATLEPDERAFTVSPKNQGDAASTRSCPFAEHSGTAGCVRKFRKALLRRRCIAIRAHVMLLARGKGRSSSKGRMSLLTLVTWEERASAELIAPRTLWWNERHRNTVNRSDTFTPCESAILTCSPTTQAKAGKALPRQLPAGLAGRPQGRRKPACTTFSSSVPTKGIAC